MMASRGIKILISSLLTIWLVTELNAQESKNEDIQLLLDAIGLEFDSDTDSEAYESFLEYLQNPINLNNADYKQLQSLSILSENQIEQLLDHIKSYGPLYSIYELQTISGFDEKTIATLKYFVEVKERTFLDHKLKGYILGRSQRLIQKKSGFLRNAQSSRFRGSLFSSLLKVRIEKSNRYNIGLSLENDAGESLKWSPKLNWYGTGFQSGYFQLKERGLIENVIIGDFLANWGQGLVFGGGFSMGKGRQTTSAHKKISLGLVPYKSTLEYGFLRGMGITLKLGSLRVSTLISSKKLDANTNEYGQVTSIVTSGLHRTTLEISKRMLVAEKTAGVNINFNPIDSKFDIGVSAALTHFGKPINPKESPENNYKNSNQTNFITGTYGEYRHRNFILYGEGAITDNKAIGLIVGGLANLSHQIDALLEYRDYAPNFTSHYAANAFRTSSLAQNEKGIYWGMRYSQLKALTITSYADIISFPWLKRTVSVPSTGSDYMISLDFNPLQSLQVRSYYRMKRGEKNSTNGIDMKRTIESHKRELLKLDAYIDLSKKLDTASESGIPDQPF
jgi:hypothetical protein